VTTRSTGEGDTQVRIVASIGNTPIYESEVREAVYQRLGEFVRGGSTDVQKEKAIFREELRRLIERELVLDEMTAVLTARKQTVGLTKLREAAVKEADQRIKEFKKERGVGTDDEFRALLRIQGLTLSGIRRQIERGFMMQAYLQEKFSDRMKWISLESIREYYDTHADEFKAEDNVKWQDLFVLTEKFPSIDAAKLYAQTMVNRATKGEDFGKLAKEFSQGDSASRDGAGIGEKRGEIFPPELEPTIMAMKQGQIQIVESGAGFHIIRIAERTYAGRKPFDDKLQADIRRKVQNQIYDREVKRLVETLWKQVQPQIWLE
jgi:parvulin-like peptidyl-prolyl isomerase